MCIDTYTCIRICMYVYVYIYAYGNKEKVSVCLLNYKKDGTPFLNQVRMIYIFMCTCTCTCMCMIPSYEEISVVFISLLRSNHHYHFSLVFSHPLIRWRWRSGLFYRRTGNYSIHIYIDMYILLSYTWSLYFIYTYTYMDMYIILSYMWSLYYILIYWDREVAYFIGVQLIVLYVYV
jgi:hypothetical protein